MSDTPTLDDIDLEDSQEIGDTISTLEVGQSVRATSNRLDRYVVGEVVETNHEPNGEEFYLAIIEEPGGQQVEIHANWRDIPPDSDDQKTPYTGLLIEPFNDTAPAVTDIEVI